MRKIFSFITVVFFSLGWLTVSCSNHQKILWQIGRDDNKPDEFALAPSGYKDFLKNDFGWEDRDFIIGVSDVSTEWPYILPGPDDIWAGSLPSNWHSQSLNILFSMRKVPSSGNWELVVDLFDCSAKNPPLLKITVNGRTWEYRLPAGSNSSVLPDSSDTGKEALIKIPLDQGLIHSGGNEINITSLQGSWLVFDQIRLEGPVSAHLKKKQAVFIRKVQAADYELYTNGNKCQPLLVDVEQVEGTPTLKVILDGKEIFSETVETGRYVFEAPMPSVKKEIRSRYKILVDGNLSEKGFVKRVPFPVITPSGYVNTMIGTAHSRWMIAPGPWMPFSMVKLSPDNQNGGWQAGYDPVFENVGGFSHIHEWTMAGLLTMPVTGPLVTKVGDQKDPDTGYRSRIDKMTEEAPLGYYKVHLTDYNIWAELTATTRCGFQRYTFPKGQNARVLLDLQFPAEYKFLLDEVKITQVNDYKIEGYSKQRTLFSTRRKSVTQEYTVHFVAEFDQPIIHAGTWTENGIKEDTKTLFVKNPKDAGMYVEFDNTKDHVVQLRTAISYVSIDNAKENLLKEIVEPFGWDFDKIVAYNRRSWDKLLGRISIESNDRREKVRFYTNLYRSLCGRNTFSDVDGSWVDANEKVQQLKDKDQVALGCDAFWNTFWNLNQVWNLVSPEWSNRWVNSELAMYDAGGWLAKGPAGMEYIPVMVAEHEIPLIVGAYQMGIRGFDAEKAFQAMKKMQTTPGKPIGGGYAGNRDLKAYLKHHYVPMDKGRFSNSLEYSFDDWTVSQMAKALGKRKDYQVFADRGEWWKNAIDPKSGYARLRKSDGTWVSDFDPFQHGTGQYVEGNAWQLTFFVPQNIPELSNIIGKERLLKRLEWGFEESYKWRYNAPNDQFGKYPVVQGNQQSMHFAFLFNWMGKPWLTQKWSRSIIDRYYGYGLSNAYLGDEDQGQMSAWFVMASLGLFQTDGGCRVNPVYEIASPLYPKVEINLGNRFGRGDIFIIKAKNVSRLNKYVQSATLNGQPLKDFKFPASQLLKGGKLELEMGPNPNYQWGIK